MSSKTGFGERLSRLMWARNMSAYSLAWFVGVHVNTVRNWLSGKYTPRIEQLQALRIALDCTYEDLIEGKGND